MIGIFDSGIGGLTVARAIEQVLPNRSLLYFGDTARTPYGTKSAEVITAYSLRNCEFLLKNGAKLIIIGCNSASSVATERLRAEFDVPILEVISPAVKRATEVTRSGRVGIIGTRATVQSGIYEEMLKASRPGCEVFSVPCPLLVPLVEEGWTNKRETKMIIRRYLHPLKDKQIDTLILGCTHYPLLKDLIGKRAGKKITVIDSSVEIAHALRDQLLPIVDDNVELSEEVSHRFYLSDVTDSARRTASLIFRQPVELFKQ